MKKLLQIAFLLTLTALALTSTIGLSLMVLMGTSWRDQQEQVLASDMNEAASLTGTIDPSTGLVVDKALPLVISNCTACHSAKLISQNRATREGWAGMITWMQETQNLWDLGANEDKILDYLARHYAPEITGRRKNLTNIEWYDLSDN